MLREYDVRLSDALPRQAENLLRGAAEFPPRCLPLADLPAGDESDQVSVQRFMSELDRRVNLAEWTDRRGPPEELFPALLSVEHLLLGGLLGWAEEDVVVSHPDAL